MPKSLREMSLAELRTARKGWEGRTDHGSKLMLQRFDQEITHVEKHGREFAEPAKGKKWGRPFGGDAVALLDPVVSVPLVGMPLTSTDDQEAHNLRRDIAYREMLQPGMVPLVGGLSLDAYVRKYPSYTTAHLEAAIAAGRGTPEMVEEVAARNDGRSQSKVTPQLTGGQVVTKVGRL